VHCGVISRDINVRRGRGRPKLTWGESIKRDLKGWNIPRDLCLNRSAWKTASHVPETWLLLLGFNSSLPQLVWNLKALLLLLLLIVSQDIFLTKLNINHIHISKDTYTTSTKLLYTIHTFHKTRILHFKLLLWTKSFFFKLSSEHPVKEILTRDN